MRFRGVPNPAGRTLRPVELITDRAKRFRAQSAIEQPERRCIYCGNPQPRDIDHVNGREDDGAPANLAYACRSCNTRKGAFFSRNGIGRKTRQYNPEKKGEGARSLAQWVTAVLSIKGQGAMDVADAVALIHATPAASRSKFARQIWDRRRERKQQVPF